MPALWQSSHYLTNQFPPPILACLLLGAGVLLLFYGWHVYRVGLVCAGVLVGAALGVALAKRLGVHPLIVALPMGLLVGISALMLQKVGAFLAGGACALIPILALREMFQSEGAFYVAAALAFLIGALLALFLWRPMITVSLAMIGASFLGNGLVIVADLFGRNWGSQTAEQHPYLITGAVIAATVFGVYFQTREEAGSESSD
jgi:hypothetical protein